MTRLLARRVVGILLVLPLTGCAIGRVTPDGVQGFAIGHAKLEACCGESCVVEPSPAPSASPAAEPTPTVLTGTRLLIEGGALSNSVSELLSSLIAAAGAAYATYLGGP